MRVRILLFALIAMLFAGVLAPGLPTSGARAETAGWYRQEAAPDGELYCVSGVDRETVWAGGYVPSGPGVTQGLLARSTDGGATWSRYVPEGTPERFGFIGISGADAGTAWALGCYSFNISTFGGILVDTFDGGATFNLRGYNWRGLYYSVSAVDPQTAWAAGFTYGGFPMISKTTDGTTWSLSYGIGIYDLYLTGISAVDANTAWAVGNRGVILKTEDGAGWANQDFPTSRKLNGVSAVSGSTAWAVGDGGLVLHTTDGVNWSAQDAGVTVNLTGVSAVSASTAWAVGQGGTILKTTDGGSTWLRQESGVTSDIQGVSAVDVNTAWAADASGCLLHTTDGGAGVPLPYVDSVTPGSGAAGTEVTVRGSGFMEDRGSSRVSFGPADAPEYVSWSDTGVVCRVPDMSQGAVPLTVTTANGTSEALEFVVTPSFTVSSITPGYGVENMVVDITDIAGTGFEEGAAVRLEKPGTTLTPTEVNVVSGSSITCRLDLTGAPLGGYDVVVRNPDGSEARLAAGFRVTNICGGGAAASLSLFGVFMGLVSLAGSPRVRRRFAERRRPVDR